MLARFGCDVSLLKFAGAAWHSQDFIRYAAVCRFALSLTAKFSATLTVLVASLLCIALAWGWSTAETMLVTIVALLPMTLIYVISSCFKSAHSPQIGALFEIGSISMLCGGVAAVLGWAGIPMTAERAAAVFVILCAVVAIIGLTIVYRRWLMANVTAVHLSMDRDEFMRTSRDFTLISNAQVLGNWGGLLLLGVFHDDAEVGVFAAVLRTALIPSLLVNIVVSICSPRLSGLHETGDFDSFRRLAQRSATGIFLVNFPVLVLMACLCQPLMQLFGSKFEPHSHILALVAVGLMVQTATALASSILSMAGRHAIVRRVTLITAIAATILSAQLAYSLGALGAAIGFGLYSTLHPAIMATIVRRELGFWPMPGNFLNWFSKQRPVSSSVPAKTVEHVS